MPGRFSLAPVSDILTDVVDERGLKVAAISAVDGQDVIWLSDAIGALSVRDLLALVELLKMQAIEREYGS